MTYKIDEASIVELYSSGASISYIARKFEVDYSVIKKRLIDQGISLRDISESTKAMYRAGLVLPSYGRPRTYIVHENCLDAITSETAYIIGLFQADGSVDQDRGRIRITLKEEDGYMVGYLANFFGEHLPTREVISLGHKGVTLEVNSRLIVDRFIYWGIHPRKTYSASTHSEFLFNRDYWRGVVDGDGSLCTSSGGRKILSLVGSRAICTQFLDFCRARNLGRKVNVRPHKSIFSVHLSDSDAITIAKVLYSNAKIALNRKRVIAESWI